MRLYLVRSRPARAAGAPAPAGDPPNGLAPIGAQRPAVPPTDPGADGRRRVGSVVAGSGQPGGDAIGEGVTPGCDGAAAVPLPVSPAGPRTGPLVGANELFCPHPWEPAAPGQFTGQLHLASRILVFTTSKRSCICAAMSSSRAVRVLFPPYITFSIVEILASSCATVTPSTVVAGCAPTAANLGSVSSSLPTTCLSSLCSCSP